MGTDLLQQSTQFLRSIRSIIQIALKSWESMLDDDAISYVSADSDDDDDNDNEDAMSNRSTRTLSNVRSDIKVR